MDALPFHEHVPNESEEDDIREEKVQKRVEEDLLDYRPVQTDGLWFERKVPADSDEELTITKFKAHAAYRKKNYQQAASLYEACAKLLPSNANLVLREVGESRARCLLKLGMLKDCEQLLFSLLEEKGNPQDSSLQALLSDVYMAQGKLNEAATCLRQCFTLHAEYAQYWVKIADVFENLANSIKCFIVQYHRNDCKEDEAFADVWYFVNVLKKCYFTGNSDHKNDKRHLENKNQVNLCNCKWHKLFGFTWKRFRKDFKNILLTEGIREDIIPAMDCNYSEARLEPTSLSCYLNSEGFQEIFLFPNNSTSFNKLVSQLEPTELQELIFTHFFSWYNIMMLSHCLALGKAWQLLRKTVQYSKGFAKEVEQRSLLEIHQRLVTSTGCQEIADWLTKVSEACSPTGKV